MRTLPLTLLKYLSALAAVLWVSQARAETRLVHGEEREILIAELLELLGIVPGINTEAKVSSAANGPWSNSVTLGTSGIGCRADGADVHLFAGNTDATATCHVQVCTTILIDPLRLCQTANFPIRAVSCVDDVAAGGIDRGCEADAPACTGGANPSCVGCLADRDCETTERRFGLGLGEVARVGVNLLTNLLGIDLGLNLANVQVGADVNGPFGDEAILETGASCRLGNDGSVELIGSETMAGESTCFVQICVPLLGICPVIDLSIVTDGCLLTGNCDSVASCDVSTNTCLACQDNNGPGSVDSGCTTATPACLGNGSEAECVECTHHDDCRSRALALNIAPTQGLTVPILDVLKVLNVLPSLIPSSVQVGAEVDGPFGDEALLGAGAELSSCAVDANGNINVLAAAVEGDVTCYVEVCLNLLGNTVETCLKTAIDISIDVCVLDNTCDLLNTCNAQNTCGGCVDSAPAGERDLGCSSTNPSCLVTPDDSTCVECTVDEDCAQSRPLLDLDLGEVGVITRDLLLTRLDLVLDLLQIDSLQVGAAIDGPFADTTTLMVNGDIANCRINVDGDIELVAQADVYGVVTCYVELCVNALELVNTCVVVPLEVNVAPCARTNTCGEQICDQDNTCATCRDIGDGVVDPGCSPDLPACLAQANDDTPTQICVECTTDADCPGEEYCSGNNTCRVDVCKDPDCVRDECTAEGDCLLAVRPDHLVTDEDVAVLADLVSNDMAVHGPLSVTQVSAPSWGSAVIRADGLVTYTPPQDFYGFDSFTYTACDARNVCGQAQVTVQVLPMNDAPMAVDDYAHTAINTPLLIDVLANDGDLDGDALYISAIRANTGNATLTIEVDQISLIPAEGFTGEFTFEYLVCDSGNLCDTAEVHVRVGGAPHVNPVTVLNDLATSTQSVLVIDVLANDVHAAGEPLHVAAVTAPRYGLVAIIDNKVHYYPIEPSRRALFNNLPESGEDTFTYTAADADGNSAVAFVTVTRSALSNGPTAVPDEVSTVMNQAVTFYPAQNDFDPNGSALRVVRFVAPRLGTVALDSTTSALTYIPSLGFIGTESFLVIIANAEGQEASATAYVHVRPTENEAPVALDDAYSFEGYLTGTTAPSYMLDVLSNDMDPNGDSLQVIFVAGAGVERVAILEDGRLSYTPPVDFAGEERFIYTITDGFGGRASAEILIQVNTEGISPVALPDSIETDEDVPVLIDVLANDSSPRNLALSTRLLNTPNNGVIEVLEDNTVRYSPEANFHGDDGFLYEACDSNNACTQSAVNVVVRPINDAPVAVDDRISTPVNTPVTFAPLANDFDVDGDALTLTTVGSSENATITQLGDQTLTVAPAADYVGEITFTYTICDPAQLCANATITVIVGGTSATPIAVDDRATVNRGDSVLIHVLANDNSPSGDSLSITSIEAPAIGSALLEANQVRYHAPADAHGDVTFRYSVCTLSSACASANVTVTVLAPANNAPNARNDQAEMDSLSPMRINVLANDSDPDGDAIHISEVGSTDAGSVSIDGAFVIFTPNSLMPTFFTYTVCDVHGACAEARVTVSLASPEELYVLTGGPSNCNSASGALWASLLGLAFLAARKRKVT